MIKLAPQAAHAPSILALGAHCDDIEIGCGAAIESVIKTNPDATIHWIVFTSNEKREQEARAGASHFAGSAAKLDIIVHDFRDGFLPYHGLAVKEAFEDIKSKIKPDLVFTHFRHDLHQDHRLISELTWNTFRNHQILEYEIPKWDGDLGSPNVFLPVSEDQAKRKIDILQRVYNSQNTKAWFTDDLFWSLLRIRGMECNSPSGLAEAFYSRKMLLNPEFTRSSSDSAL